MSWGVLWGDMGRCGSNSACGMPPTGSVPRRFGSSCGTAACHTAMLASIQSTSCDLPLQCSMLTTAVDPSGPPLLRERVETAAAQRGTAQMRSN